MSKPTSDINAVPLESPEDWVTQDRVPARHGVDQYRYIFASGAIGAWITFRGELDYWHGEADDLGDVLELRCHRKDLPPIADTSGTPSGIEALVCADIAERQKLGIAKYGTTVADNPLTLREWLNHAYQECLDQAVYLRRAMEELD